jgi:PKD repeat protein
LSLASVASAQFSVVIPNGYAAVEGSTSNAFPWGRGGTGLLHQCVYDSSHFTLQGITYPILITGLKWRPNTSVALVASSYTAGCSVRLSTCPVDWNSTTTTFATNRGADETLCYSGVVSWAAQPAQVGPTPFGISIPFQNNFLYDPNAGDLNIECDLPIQTFTGTGPQLDVHAVAGQANAARIYWSTGYTGYPGGVASGRDANHAVVVEVDYTPANGLFAAFSATPTAGVSPLAVNFTSTSYSSDPGGITSYAWDFDGDSVIDSTAQNPSFVYTNCGSYTVSLTITDASHPPSTLTRTNYIATDNVAANFTSQVIGPNLVQFTDTSTPTPTSWAWDFDGDSIIDSTAQNPVWLFPNSNPTNVSLTASRLCGAPSTVIKSVSPVQALTVNLAANNGGASLWTLLFNVDVLNPLGVDINAFDVISSSVSTPFTLDIYLKQGTYVGSEFAPAAWTKVSTASGTSNAVANAPSHATMPLPIHIPQGSYGLAMRYIGIVPRYTTQATLITVGNGDMNLTLGASAVTTAGPFAGSGINSPRAWSGTVYYGTNNVTGLAGYGWFGQGCAGSLGRTSIVNTNEPQIGGTLTTNLDNLPFGIAVMVIGLSNTLSGGAIPLPLDLGFVGAPGCPLRVSLDATDTVVGVAPTASWSFAIPANPVLMGFLIYNQAAVLDTVNAFGFVTSNAYGWVIGN